MRRIPISWYSYQSKTYFVLFTDFCFKSHTFDIEQSLRSWNRNKIVSPWSVLSIQCPKWFLSRLSEPCCASFTCRHKICTHLNKYPIHLHIGNSIENSNDGKGAASSCHNQSPLNNLIRWILGFLMANAFVFISSYILFNSRSQCLPSQCFARHENYSFDPINA